MASVPNGVETLPKIVIASVGCTNVTERRQTDDRRTTYNHVIMTKTVLLLTANRQYNDEQRR